MLLSIQMLKSFMTFPEFLFTHFLWQRVPLRSHTLKPLTVARGSEWCITADRLDFQLSFRQCGIWTAAFASDCAFSKAHSFQFSNCLCHHQKFFNFKKTTQERRVHGWSALHGFHSLQHNSRIKKLHGGRWILNNYVDSIHRDMPSLAAEVLLLCFMWLLHCIEGAW